MSISQLDGYGSIYDKHYERTPQHMLGHGSSQDFGHHHEQHVAQQDIREREESRVQWLEYEDLLDRARQQFALLRELPMYGRHEDAYQKAFQLYAALWKRQQDHRQALVAAGLQRWEIGDLASRIGQLYVSFYMRTSGLSFLQEAFTFYEAIQARQYFPAPQDEPQVAVKQLRFFARFLIVCVLLNRREDAWSNFQAFQKLVQELEEAQALDMHEWHAVLEEAERFLQADVLMQLTMAGVRTASKWSLRCSPSSQLAQIPFTAPLMRLHSAVLVGHYQRQLKMADVPLDVCRMLQTLEWEDPSASGSISPDAQFRREDWSGEGAEARDNPAKVLLHKPTATELLAVIASTCEALPSVSVLMVYIAAAAQDSRLPGPQQPGNDAESEDSSMSPMASAAGCDAPSICLCPPSSSGFDDSFLYPEDLLPFTRRPLFIVIDANSSRAFARIHGGERGYPACCLMSPPQQPPEVCRPSQSGRLFTLWLTFPSMAMCLVNGVAEPDAQVLSTVEQSMEGVMAEWGEQISAAGAPADWASPWASTVFGDVLSRRVLLRFVLCRAVLALHQRYAPQEELQPSCFPDLPEMVAPSAPMIHAGVMRVATILGKGNDYMPSPGQARNASLGSFQESSLFSA